ncbi:MAG: uracil-DNA glycosylase [Alphaproteobacteria bacterium]|nr:uracil-DNA glycosylase [Alphaproteobacteria bacterium]
MKKKILNDWNELLNEEFNKEYYVQLRSFLVSEYKNKIIFPPKEDVFKAFEFTAYLDVKVVILGQDPYHEFGQAHGLAFSVPADIKFPPSLRNIIKELESDLKIETSKNFNKDGVLISWAKQGVLLLNTVLTVEEHNASSHKNKGWEQFTDAVIKVLAKKSTPIVFILWGKNAIAKEKMILDNQRAKHLIIKAPHPSPLSAYRGFFGGKYFSKTNKFLEKNAIEPINWNL